VAGDLTSVFNFATPNAAPVQLPSTSGDLPPVEQLAGGNVNTFVPTLGEVTIGVPAQEKGIRPARALPYTLNVYTSVNALYGTVSLTFANTGSAAVVFQVRSGNPADVVRFYTVEAGKMSDAWNIVASSYSLSVYGPNGFARYFNGSTGASAAILGVVSAYGVANGGVVGWKITNLTANDADVNILDAYTGTSSTSHLQGDQSIEGDLSLGEFYGWYDVIITVAEDLTFQYRLAGHVETGQDSFSDPAMGGLVTLKG
jgi:phospholipase C